MNFTAAVESVRDFIWSPPLIVLILGTGIYMTIRLRGVQFRYFFYALRLVFSPKRSKDTEGDISPFQALMTALAATIGIGSIAGVATALAAGGVGALLWMVVAALIGMATVYAESYLAVQYRIRDRRREMSGGPMYYIHRGLGWRWLAVIFAVGGVATSLTTGNMVQANSMTDVLVDFFPGGRWVMGMGIALCIGIVLIGGIKSIGRVAAVLVPIMAVSYLVGGFAVLALSWRLIPDAIVTILTAAFRPQAAAGGFLGASVFMALRMGVSKGLFASESGLGSQPIAAAAARTDAPGRQALISMTGAFLSVCVVCVVTGLAITVTGVLGSTDSSGKLLNGVPLTVAAFERALSWGKYVVIVGAVMFGYSTILGWAYYGEKCFEYLAGERFIPLYRIGFTLMVALGSGLGLKLVWCLADITNACMTVPNLIGLVGLAGVVTRGTMGFRQVVYAESQAA